MDDSVFSEMRTLNLGVNPPLNLGENPSQFGDRGPHQLSPSPFGPPPIFFPSSPPSNQFQSKGSQQSSSRGSEVSPFLNLGELKSPFGYQGLYQMSPDPHSRESDFFPLIPLPTHFQSTGSHPGSSRGSFPVSPASSHSQSTGSQPGSLPARLHMDWKPRLLTLQLDMDILRGGGRGNSTEHIGPGFENTFTQLILLTIKVFYWGVSLLYERGLLAVKGHQSYLDPRYLMRQAPCHQWDFLSILWIPRSIPLT